LLYLLFESIFFVVIETNKLEIDSSSNESWVKISDEIGFYPEKNKVVEKTRYINGEIVYNVTYSIDRYSRRATPSSGTKHLILFGGSYTFGTGLEDDEVLSSFLSDGDYSVYNYAFGDLLLLD
jgi:hypothetical protein